jgi:AraC-like DNA-binding protein
LRGRGRFAKRACQSCSKSEPFTGRDDQQVRLAEALNRLEKGEPVATVADALGYASPSAFESPGMVSELPLKMAILPLV